MAKILVVEDDINLQNNLKEYLTLYGNEVLCASNGLEALALLDTILPDVIVCDVMMPSMDGHAFLKVKESNARLQLIPLIHITAKIDHEQRLNSLQTGAFDYLFKPFSLKELVYKIDNIIKLKNASFSEPTNLVFSGADSEVSLEPNLAFKKKFTDLLNENYSNQALTIEEASYKLGMSVSTLQRWLTRYFDKSFGNLLKEYRLEKAKSLLLSSDKTIEEIARQCGISSLSYFSRIFKEAYTIPPVRFRLENVRNTKK